MTEIVNNNNGMAFDLLETGNSASATLSNGKFNSFFSDIDSSDDSDFQSGELKDRKLSSLEETVSEVINILKESDLNIDTKILSDIALKLRNFFDKFASVETAGSTQNTNTHRNIENDSFLQLMKFLDKIKGILNLNANKGLSQEQEINRVLDQITPKLNDQIKAHMKRNSDSANGGKNAFLKKQDATINQNSLVKPSEANLIKSNNFSSTESSKENSNAKAPDNAEMIQAKIRDRSTKSKIKPKSLGKVIESEKNSESASNLTNKIGENKSEPMLQQTSSSGALGKDLLSESNFAKQSTASIGKMNANNTSSQENLQRAPSFNNEPSNRLLDNLNMLSKSWGEKLIEKIEKSMVDSIEKLEISLSPKSLGKLNITINMQESIAKISIIAENSSVAALLGEAEAKLSQMMEATGLKLASLQTLTQQFGQNKKGKEQTQKFNLSKKKDNINDPDKTSRKINNEESQKEGLNLIA